MKTPEQTNELITRWIDGTLDDVERAGLEAEMGRNPALRAEAEAMQQLGSLLRANVTIEKPLQHADFFNSQIQERIAELQRSEKRSSSASGGALGWLRWLRTPWAIAGAAAVIALGLFISQMGSDDRNTQVHNHYTPNPNVRVESFHSNEADATVLILDGLDAYPEGRDFSRLNIHHSERDVANASTKLVSDTGDVLLVMK
jgi:anti-sigma factor RsiW